MSAPAAFQQRDEVRYTPRHSASEGDCEVGIVTSTSTEYVFVRFDGDITSKACYPRDLTLLKRQA